MMLPANAQMNSTQTIDDNLVSWNWLRVDATFGSAGQFGFSNQVHFRFRDAPGNFYQALLRPMLGYRLHDNTFAWVGYATVWNQASPSWSVEQRLFQLVTYGGKIENTPWLVIGASMIEERFMPESKEVGFRFRQLARVSFDLYKHNKSTWALIFQDEVFLRLNQPTWTQQHWFDHNRFQVGIDYRTQIRKVPVVWNASYMNANPGNTRLNGVNSSLRITIPHIKRPQKRNAAID
jgi:hypothetical protein